MTASCQMQDVEGTRPASRHTGAPACLHRWSHLSCRRAFRCEKSEVLQSGGPGCASVEVSDVLNRVLVALRVCADLGLRSLPLWPQECNDPGLQEAFPGPVPLGAFDAALPSPSLSAHTWAAGVVLLRFTAPGRACVSLQEEGGMGSLSLPGLSADCAPSSISLVSGPPFSSSESRTVLRARGPLPT